MLALHLPGLPDGGVTSLLGVAAGLGASVAWALANVFIQKASRMAGAVMPVLWGQIIGGAVLLAALPFFPPPGGSFDRISVPWVWLIIGALSSAVAYSSMFRAFAGGPISVVSPVISSWALISSGLGVLVFGEALPVQRIVGAVLVIGGAMTIAARSRGRGDTWSAPITSVIGYSVASAMGFGVMVAAVRPLTADLGPVLTIAALWSGQWVFAGPLMLRPPFVPPRGTWLAIAALGVLEAVGFLCLEAGVHVAPISVVAPASSLSVLFTVILGRVWLKEAVGIDRALLAVVIVVGIVVLGMA